MNYAHDIIAMVRQLGLARVQVQNLNCSQPTASLPVSSSESWYFTTMIMIKARCVLQLYSECESVTVKSHFNCDCNSDWPQPEVTSR
jgi:hypothetical protein